MKKRLSKKTLISVCTLIAALIIWTMWSNTALMLSTVTVSSNRIPAAFNGFRIAQISDLHNAVFGEDNAELLQILSECEPNIIVITGDLVDARLRHLHVLPLDFQVCLCHPHCQQYMEHRYGCVRCHPERCQPKFRRYHR